MFGLVSIIDLAIIFTIKKFPEEAILSYNTNRETLFDVATMVAEELQIKNGDLFVKDYMKDYVDVKDLAIGDKNVFYMAE